MSVRIPRPPAGLPKSKSTWAVNEPTKARAKGVSRMVRGQRCHYCNQLGHNKRSCTKGGLPMLHEQLQFLRGEKNPFEWERWKVAKDALRLIAKSRGPGTRAAREAARLGLFALGVPL